MLTSYPNLNQSFEQEIASKQRFEFGKNWAAFLSTLNQERITQAENALKELLKRSNLDGLRFLDVGSGSGLSSLAARRLGAQVYSFDYDPQSVACTQQLKQRFFPDDANWTIERASVLDPEYLKSLGEFDIVYSWGVLHHTGAMWPALENICLPTKPGGQLYIAIYNDQGVISKIWLVIKKFYCSGILGRCLVLAIFVPYFFLVALIKSLLAGKNLFKSYKENRGMSWWHDWVDWLGGYPFEVASVEALQGFFEGRGFKLMNLKRVNSLGNNQLVFLKG